MQIKAGKTLAPVVGNVIKLNNGNELHVHLRTATNIYFYLKCSGLPGSWSGQVKIWEWKKFVSNMEE